MSLDGDHGEERSSRHIYRVNTHPLRTAKAGQLQAQHQRVSGQGWGQRGWVLAHPARQVHKAFKQKPSRSDLKVSSGYRRDYNKKKKKETPAV